MNTPTMDGTLEDILHAYVAAAGTPNHATLTEWTRRYPRYAQELADFTATWSLPAWLPPSPAMVPVDEADLLRRGMALIQGVLQRSSREAAPPLVSLVAAGKARGLSLKDVAERADLSIPLLMKLDRRLLRVTTIPRSVLESVAGAIGHDIAALTAYLQGTPRFGQGVSYRAQEAPRLAEQEDFTAAVRDDLTLSNERRASLLALAPDGEIGDSPVS